jgi:hypothetical protein
MMVEDAIAAGQSYAGRGAKTIYYSPSNTVSVVMGRDGTVITVGYAKFKGVR